MQISWLRQISSHLIVSVGVFRWCKCCASYNIMFCVLLPYSTSCIYCKFVASWCSCDHNTYWVLDFGLLLLNSLFLPLDLSYITTPGTFLYLLMVLQGPGRKLSLHWFPCDVFHLLIFSAGLKLILDIFGSSFFCHIFCVVRLAFLGRECLVFLASYSCTNLVGLSWPCLIYLQRPTTAASYADSSSTNPRPPLRLLM